MNMYQTVLDADDHIVAALQLIANAQVVSDSERLAELFNSLRQARRDISAELQAIAYRESHV